MHLPAVRRWLGQPGHRATLAVFAVAVVPRLGFVLRGGGLGGTYRYDPGVYYAASAALLNGRLPYRDYVLLHPPGVVLAVSPFAALGELFSDHLGFILATLGFIAIGSVNAVLVRSVALRMGLARGAALLGGLFYAVWVGAVGSEYLIRLEVLGNLLVLLALRTYLGTPRAPSNRPVFLAGLAFGAAVATKIWFVVPGAVVLGYDLVSHRSWARSRVLILGVAASVAVLVGPFAVAAPRAMWHMVIVDQLGRPHRHSLIWRLGYISSASVFHPGSATGTLWTVVAFATILVSVSCVVAWRARSARLAVLILVAQLAVLIAAPPYFPFYNDFAAAPLAIVVAAAAHVIAARAPSVRRGRPRTAMIAVLAGTVAGAAAAAVFLPEQGVLPFPRDASRAVAGSRCVMSDSPTVLIELNVLTRDLEDGCRNWVDVSGRGYGLDRTYLRDGQPVSRAANRTWQRRLTRYLYSGDTLILYRPTATGIGSALRRKLAGTAILTTEGGVTVYCTRPPSCAG